MSLLPPHLQLILQPTPICLSSSLTEMTCHHQQPPPSHQTQWVPSILASVASEQFLLTPVALTLLAFLLPPVIPADIPGFLGAQTALSSLSPKTLSPGAQVHSHAEILQVCFQPGNSNDFRLHLQLHTLHLPNAPWARQTCDQAKTEVWMSSMHLCFPFIPVTVNVSSSPWLLKSELRKPSPVHPSPHPSPPIHQQGGFIPLSNIPWSNPLHPTSTDTPKSTRPSLLTRRTVVLLGWFLDSFLSLATHHPLR